MAAENLPERFLTPFGMTARRDSSLSVLPVLAALFGVDCTSQRGGHGMPRPYDDS